MEIVFTDLFRHKSIELGLEDRSVLETTRNCDKMQELSYDGLVLRVFIKRESDDSHILVLAQLEQDHLNLLLPFRVLNDLFRHIEVLEPLMVLELLAQNYGLVVRIGERLGRFIYQEEIGIQGASSQIVSVSNPNDHDFTESFFVKLVDTPSGRIAKCALAFCIDTHVYQAWLRSKSSETRQIQSLSVSRIIGVDTVKRIIESNAKEREAGKRFNLTELDLALEVIKAVMGQQWYDTVLVRDADVSSRTYQRLVRSNAVHPLSEALWSGRPEKYVRVIQLGIYLNQLWRTDNSNRLMDKVKELRQYSFDHTYYEIKMSAYFDRRNYQVSFIPREKEVETPDFRIDAADGFAFAECKRKDSESLQIDSDVEKAASQLEGYGGPGVIFIEILTGIDHQTAKEMLDRGKQLLEGMKNICLLVITHEVLRDEVDTIALGTRVRGVKISSTKLRLPPSIEKASYFNEPVSWLPLSQS